MAIQGTGFSLDVTFKAEASLRTSTTQYMAVGMVPGTTTTEDYTVALCGFTAAALTAVAPATVTAKFAIGINQSYLSSGALECSVRLFGLSKAICAHSIGAGSWVIAYNGISTTVMAGKIQQLLDGATATAYGMTATSQVTILGRALESGSTNSVITIFLNPHLNDLSVVGSLTVT